jgi:HAD superfamily hydrolase (TIGR01450 family)
MNYLAVDIRELKNEFDIFIFDAYGVFWDGSKFYENSIETMKWLRDSGKIVAILSNTTQLSSDAAEKYREKGLISGVHYDLFVTSGDVTRDVILSDNFAHKKIYQFGTPTKTLFANSNWECVNSLEEADLIYISLPQLPKDYLKTYGDSLVVSTKTGLYDSLTIDPFIPLIEELLKANIPILNINPDLTAPEAGKYVIRQGYIAQELKKRGAEVIEFGKPHKMTYDFLFDCLKKKKIEVDKSRICMVGDTIRTDIRGALNAEITGVLCTETGVTSEALKRGAVLDDLLEESGIISRIFTIRGIGMSIYQ